MPVPSGIHAASVHKIPWTPILLSPRVWLDATLSGITKDGSNQVSQWNDLSGNGRHATQPTALRGPIHDAANNWMAFSATARFFTAGANPGYLPSGNNAWTYACVFRFPVMPTGATTIITIYRQGNRANNTYTDFGVGMYGGPFNRFFFSHYGFDASGTQLPVINTDYIWINTYDPAVGRRLYINGNTTPDESNAYVSQNLPASSTERSMGADIASTELRGESRQRSALAFDGALTQTNRQLLEGYLAHKWGLQANLMVGHPYRDNPPYL